jgi:hypothetical protein
MSQSVERLSTGWTVRGSNPTKENRFCSSPERLRVYRPWGPPCLYAMDTGGSSSGGKASRRGVVKLLTHLHPPSAEVKNAWSFTSIPTIHLQGLQLYALQ